MEKADIAKELIALRIATRRACTVDSGSHKKGTLSLCDKILFLLSRSPMTPNNIVDALLIQKSNLACLSKQMEKNGLITRTRKSGAREIVYRITDEGKACLEAKLDEIKQRFSKFLKEDKEYEDAAETLAAAYRLLSFLED